MFISKNIELMTNPAGLQKFDSTKLDNTFDNQAINARFLALVEASKHVIN
jgi:hypothetical protein